MRLCKAFACWLLLVLLPFTASALGLGKISLESALNEPFAADIPVQSYEGTDLRQLKVEMASSDAFDRSQLDRPEFLNDFQFAVTENANGDPIVRVTSRTPVAEPFVTILLDVKWASGRLFREYTVLLDPPVYDQPAVQSEVTPAATPVVESAETIQLAEEELVEEEIVIEPAPVEEQLTQTPAVTVTQEPVAETESVTVLEASPLPEPEPVVSEEPVAAPVVAGPQGDYTTTKGDTLWGISERSRAGTGLTNNQMMLAIYRANPEAFLGNINALKAGAILRMPEQSDAADISVGQANAEAQEQHSAWADDAATEPQATPVEGQLELVVPGSDPVGGDSLASSGDSAATDARVSQLESELEESQRLLQIRDAEMQALQERVAELEQTQPAPGDIEVDETPIGEDEPVTDEQFVVEELDEAADSPFVDDAEILADESLEQEVAAEADVAPLDQPEPSVPEQISEAETTSLLGNFWLWGAVALALLAGLFVARRRRGDDEDEPALATGGDVAEHDMTVKDFSDLPTFDDPVVVEEEAPQADAEEVPEAEPEPLAAAEEDDELETSPSGVFEIPATDKLGEDEPDHSPTMAISPLDAADLLAKGDDEAEMPLERTISTGAPLNLDQADPVAEAEFHMAYGLYDQAADLLIRALQDEPDNRAYRVKLIEVYFVWENKEGFMEQAGRLHESIADDSDSDWNKVLILGKQLCPDEDLFSGSAASAPTADSMDLELSEDAGEMDIDFSLGDAAEDVLAGESGGAGDGGALDFDLGGGADDTGLGSDLALDLGDDADDEGVSDFDKTTRLTEDDLSETTESPTAEMPASDADESLTFDPGARTSRLSQDDDLAATIESPTAEFSGTDDPTVEIDHGASTMESPTAEYPGADDPTVEIDHGASTMESPTVENSLSGDTVETPALDEDGGLEDSSLLEDFAPDAADESGQDATMESPTMDVPDLSASADPTSLDVDLSGLADLDEPGSEPASETDAADSGVDPDDTFSQLDNTGELLTPEDMSRTIAGHDLEDAVASSAANAAAEDTFSQLDNTGELLTQEDMGKTIADDGSSFVSDGEDTSAPAEENASDTVSNPAVDDSLDIDDTAEQPEVMGNASPDDATMTEVGTKLDLARAYIDMGDPDGARSILNEVLDEGGDSQKQEARQLLEELGG